MKTLLQINATVNSGSTGRIAEGIGRLAAANGWRNYIAYGRWQHDSAAQLVRIGRRPDIWMHGLRSRLLDQHGLGSTTATERFIRTIGEIKPDVIHLHNIHGYYLNYRLLFEYLQRADAPVVWTLHDCWPFTGHCANFDLAGCGAWRTGCLDCLQLNTYPKSFFRDCSQENFRLKKKLFTSLGDRLTLVPVSDWLAGLLRQSFFRDTPIQVIHNGIDLAVFTPQPIGTVREKYGLGKRHVLLGVAGPWSERKGLFDFYKLRAMLPCDQYAIILVGLSEVQRKQLPEGIVGLPRTEAVRELAVLYSAADVYVNPTYEDNYPTVNLEAMACGTPVVTYRTGGSPEAVTPETGLVAEQGNIEELAVAVRTIAANGRQAYTTACQTHAAQFFDQRKCFQQYIDLYDRIL